MQSVATLCIENIARAADPELRDARTLIAIGEAVMTMPLDGSKVPTTADMARSPGIAGMSLAEATAGTFGRQASVPAGMLWKSERGPFPTSLRAGSLAP